MDFSYICFFKIMNFSDRLRQCLQITFTSGNQNHKADNFLRYIKLFYSFEKYCSGIFLNFQKISEVKQCDRVYVHYCCKETYLELSQTSTMEIFCENSQQLKAINYFRKKSPSQMFHLVLNTSLLQVSAPTRTFFWEFLGIF